MGFSRCPVAVGGGLAAALMASAATGAPVAQPPAPPPAAAAPDGDRGVITYPATFFAPMGLETAYNMVLRIPGFAFDDGSAVRGFAGAAGNVLIDGLRPASKTDDLASILARLPASQVERIDLIRGGAPGIDMQGKAIVANVIRKKGGGFTGDVAVAAYKPEDVPFDPQLRVEGRWRWDDHLLEASFFAFMGHDDSQGSGPHDIFAPDGRLTDVSAMHNSAPNSGYTGVATYESPLVGGKLRVNLTLQDQPAEKLAVDDFHVAGRQVERDRSDATDAELGLHYDRALTPTLALEALGLQHLNKTGSASDFDTETDHQAFGLSHTGGETIGRGILHWRPSAGLDVDTGGEFAYNFVNTRTRFSDNGVAIAVPAADVRVSEKRGEAFATATWRALPALTVEAGVRVEASTIASTGDVAVTNTLVFPKPRLLVTWSPDALDQVRLRVEREVGQLDFNAFVAGASLNGNGVVAGNPNLTPQQDWAIEAAYDRHFWKDGVVSLTLRHLFLKDVVDRAPVFTPSGVFDEPANIGVGMETDIVASFNLPLDRFGLTGAALRGLGTWRFSEVTDPTTGEKRPISGQHPLDAELHFSQDLPRWRVNWGIDVSLVYRERFFRFDEIDTNINGTYETVFVIYKARPDVTLRFELDNAGRRPFKIEREVFGGPRNLDPPQFIDVQDHRFGLILFGRIRKTFG